MNKRETLINSLFFKMFAEANIFIKALLFIIYDIILLATCCLVIVLYFCLRIKMFPEFNYSGRWRIRAHYCPKNYHLRFDHLPYPVKVRFITILPAEDLRRFSYTSKSQYISCLEFRGLPTTCILIRKEISLTYFRVRPVRIHYESQSADISYPLIGSNWLPYLSGAEELLLDTNYSNLWDAQLFEISVKIYCIGITERLTEEEKEFLFELAERKKDQYKVYDLIFCQSLDIEFCIKFMKFRNKYYNIYLPKFYPRLDAFFAELKDSFDLKIKRQFLASEYIEAVLKDAEN